MKSQRTWCILVLILGIAWILPGCGGDDEEEPENPAEATDQQGKKGVPREFRISEQPFAHLKNNDDVLDIAFSPDSRRLFALHRSGDIVRVSEYNVDTQQQVGTWNIGDEDTSPYASMSMSRDGKSLAINLIEFKVDNVPAVFIWDIPAHKIIRTLEMKGGFSDYVEDIVYSPDGQTLAALVEGFIFLWNTTYQQIAKIRLDSSAFERLAFSPNSQLLAVANSSDHLVEFVDMNAFQIISSIEDPGPEYRILGLSFSPDGHFLAIGGYEGRDGPGVLELRNAETHHLVITPDFPERIGTLAYHPEGILLAVGGFTDPVIRVWNTITQQFIATMKTSEDLDRGLCFSPDGSLLAAGLDNGGGILLWKVE